MNFKRMHHHARIAEGTTPGWKRDTVSGIAYYGFQNDTMNACGTYSKDTDMIAGVGPNYYGNMDDVSSKCFQHLTVSLASDPSTSIDVTLTDACEDCGDPGNIYLSPSAFEALSGGSLDAGILDVTWSFGSSGTTAPASTPSDSSSSDDDGDDDCSDDGDSSTAEAESTADAATTQAKAAATTTQAKAAATTTQAKAAATTTHTTTAAAQTTSSKTSTAAAKSTGTSNEGWKLKSKLEGNDFLNFFNYDSGTNDNGGVANYVNGVNEGLAYVSGDQVILAVDTAEQVAARNSLRMVSKTTYNAKDMNLFIFDIAAMPAVCGTWPAVWFTGANWPYQGEIDVVEGVSLYTENIYSVHTGSGCTIPSSSVSAMTQVTIVEGTDCDATQFPAGCGFSDKEATTFGPGFNKAGGGVFALQFDTTGINMWFFQTGSVPSDITALAPNPSTWGTPRMSVPTSSCSPTTYFSDLMMVVDTNLGGSFTEGVWGTDGAGGQATSCKTQTNTDTAADYVLNNGGKFGDDAQFRINGFYVYQQ
ncbi:glycoside hydrolase family 16 protein [Mycena sanguinolenta]|nr:glycoside hydrolase family 16 protein [Mycena sanguinolenta]